MDGSELTLSGPSLPQGAMDSIVGEIRGRLDSARAENIDAASEAKKKQIAKDFESVLIIKILEQMKETIPQSGLFEDPAGEQIQNMFWMYLGREIADQGGFGLWKQIYETMRSGNGGENLEKILDKKI